MPPNPAPWRAQFLQHIKSMPMPLFALSTTTPKASFTSDRHVPRVRYCVFRGLWGHAISDQRNSAESNPDAYESDCIMITTDARMSKVEHIFGSPTNGEADTDTQGSGGGGFVEGVFWMPEAKMQWRIAGDAWVIAPDIDDTSKAAVKMAREKVTERMRVIDEEKTPKWSWSKELTYIFGAQSPAIRGSFAQPHPGQPVPDGEDFPPTKRINDLHDPEARRNFRVVVIRPFEVEALELKDPARRWLWTYKSDGSWNHERIYP